METKTEKNKTKHLFERKKQEK